MAGSWVGIGGVFCEVGASQMADTWGHSLEKIDALCWRVLPHLGQEIILGLRCGTEERESVSQVTEGIYFGDLKDWSNLFHMTVPPPSHAHDWMQQPFSLMEMWYLYFLPHLHLLVFLLVHTVSYPLWHHVIKIGDYADADGSQRTPSTWT